MLNNKENLLLKNVVVIVGLISTLFHIYFLGFSSMPTWDFRIFHLTFMLLLIFLDRPMLHGDVNRKYFPIDFIAILATISVCSYFLLNIDRLVLFIQFDANPIDQVMSLLGVVLTLEATRRISGNAMPLLAIFFLSYAWFGKYIPGMFGHNGYSPSRFIPYVFSLEGVFGISLGVSATYMIVFIIFSAVLEGTGCAKLIVDGSLAAFGKYRGGPGKAAVIASAGMGTISGSSAANVVATGTFTIPLMKKIGYSPTLAGAIEAVASSGGQIMPPVMGAGAFIMAETLGIPYARVIGAAAIPAILYFVSIFTIVDIEAIKVNLRGLPKKELPNFKIVFKEYGHLLIPIFVLIYILVIEKATPLKAGLFGSYSAFIVALFRKSTRYNLKKLINILSEGSTSAINIVPACATAGIIIGVLALTGLGTKVAGGIVAFSKGNLILGMFLTMIASLILGMGLPTTAAYIITAGAVAPALVRLGLTPLKAHLFIFYFGCMSTITPPVALAAYAGAGVSGANPTQTGFTAFRLGLVAFLIPYMFVFSDALLGVGSIYVIIRSCISAVIGTMIFACFVSNWLFKPTSLIVRLLLLVSSILLIEQHVLTDIIGIGLFFLCVFIQKNKK